MKNKKIESQNIEGKTLADIFAELRAYLTGSKTDISDSICSNCDTGSNYTAYSNSLKLKRRKKENLRGGF